MITGHDTRMAMRVYRNMAVEDLLKMVLDLKQSGKEDLDSIVDAIANILLNSRENEDAVINLVYTGGLREKSDQLAAEIAHKTIDLVQINEHKQQILRLKKAAECVSAQWEAAE